MRKGKMEWEKKYEEYSEPSGEFQQKLSELEEKYNNKNIGREEYIEYKKLTAIKNNLPKVKNILDLKGKLQEKINDLESEISIRKEIEDKEKENQKLETEMQKLQLEVEELEKENAELRKELQANNLSDKEKEDINKRIGENESKLQVNMQKRQENNVKFGNNHEFLKAKKEEQEKDGKFNDMSLEELKNELTETYQNRSICNVACTNLMEGRSWESVEVAIEEYRNKKFIARGSEADKMKQNRKAAKEKGEKAKSEKADPEKVEEPEKVEPEKVEPVKEEPVKAEPVKAEPAKAEPVKAEPVKAEPEKVEPEKEETEKEETEKEETEKAVEVPANLTLWQKIKNAIKKWLAAGFEDPENEEVVEGIVEEVEDVDKEDKDNASDKETKTSLWQRLIKALKRQKDDKEEVVEPEEVEPEEVEPEKVEPEKVEPEKVEPEKVEPEKVEPENAEPVSKHAQFTQYLRFVAENGINVDPAEKAKEDEINQTVQKLVEAKKVEAIKNGVQVSEEQLASWNKTARSVAESSYNRKHPVEKSVDNEGPEK